MELTLCSVGGSLPGMHRCLSRHPPRKTHTILVLEHGQLKPKISLREGVVGVMGPATGDLTCNWC